MFVNHGPHDGYEVSFTPQEAPNPRFCSDPRILCPKCAALALAQRGITANVSADDDDAPLIPPTLEDLLANERAIERKTPTANVSQETYDSYILRLPVWNFEQAGESRNANEYRDDPDMLPLPSLF